MKRATTAIALLAVGLSTYAGQALAANLSFTCGGNTKLTIRTQPPEAVISGAIHDFDISLPRRESQPFWAVYSVGGVGHCQSAAPCAEVDQGGNGARSALYVLETGQPVTCEER